MEFIWNDKDADDGFYRLFLVSDNGIILKALGVIDYTSDSQQKMNRLSGYPIDCAFRVLHSGIEIKRFDYDKDANTHKDKEGRLIGGYNGVCTHTLEDVKAWCENFIAQQYLVSYNRALDNLKKQEQMAKWFKDKGFKLDVEEEKEDTDYEY